MSTRIEVTLRIVVADIARAKVIHDSLQTQADAIAEIVNMDTIITEDIKLNEE